ncbi:MAG: DUF1080 domain-containing protein [Verrucomicrobia bacterium]|nr:DUF1080 domain-containing protein [Verrucomicrobiota bacterium]
MNRARLLRADALKRSWRLLLAIVLAGLGEGFGHAAEQRWEPLFNGRDFDGFAFHLGKEGADNKGTFSIRDGVMICSGTPSGYLYTRKSYRRYVLEYEWAFKRPGGLKADKDFRSNSGCLIHIGATNALGVWPRSIEVQGAHHQAGLILKIPRNLRCQVTDDKEARTRALKPVGVWQTTTIDVDGPAMTVSLNGIVVSTVRDCELTEGPIGFQSEGREIHFRTIRIRGK